MVSGTYSSREGTNIPNYIKSGYQVFTKGLYTYGYKRKAKNFAVIVTHWAEMRGVKPGETTWAEN